MARVYTSRLVVARLLLRGAICVAFALLTAAYGVFERPDRGADVAFVAIVTAAFAIAAFVCFRRARIEQRAIQMIELRRRASPRN